MSGWEKPSFGLPSTYGNVEIEAVFGEELGLCAGMEGFKDFSPVSYWMLPRDAHEALSPAPLQESVCSLVVFILEAEEGLSGTQVL